MFDIKLWTEHSTQRLPFIEDLYKSLLQTITKCSTNPSIHCHCKLFNVLNMQVHVYVHINHCKFSIIRYCNLTKFHIPAFLPTYKWNENHQDVQIRCKSVLNNNKYPVLTHNGDSKTAPHQVYQSRLPGSAVSEILLVSCLRGFHQGPLSSSWFGTFPSMVYLPCAASSLIVVPWWCCLYL